MKMTKDMCDKWLGSMKIFIEVRVYPKYGKFSYSKIYKGDCPKSLIDLKVIKTPKM